MSLYEDETGWAVTCSTYGREMKCKQGFSTETWKKETISKISVQMTG